MTGRIRQTDDPKHKHEWKRDLDWDFGPNTKVYTCLPCRGLRTVRTAPVPTGGGQEGAK